MAMTAEVCREGSWSATIPAEGLASGSVYLQPTGQKNSESDLFVVMQKVAQFWESKGIKNYLVYTNSREAGWEMVPYSGVESSGWDEFCSYTRQVEVMTRVIWGRYSKTENEQKRDYTECQDIASVEVKETADDVIGIGTDVFCQPEIIEKQQIWEGRKIYVLYDYAPLGEDKLHFLLIPKMHKEGFSELSLDEFTEMQEVAEKVAALYPDYICYKFHKAGKLAGQTVRHFHEHLVFVKPWNEWKGQAGVFGRMVMPPSPLSPEELEQRVAVMKEQCANL